MSLSCSIRAGVRFRSASCFDLGRFELFHFPNTRGFPRLPHLFVTYGFKGQGSSDLQRAHVAQPLPRAREPGMVRGPPWAAARLPGPVQGLSGNKPDSGAGSGTRVWAGHPAARACPLHGFLGINSYSFGKQSYKERGQRVREGMQGEGGVFICYEEPRTFMASYVPPQGCPSPWVPARHGQAPCRGWQGRGDLLMAPPRPRVGKSVPRVPLVWFRWFRDSLSFAAPGF